MALAVLKFIAGLLGHSGAMISDAVHSASDVFSSIIVIIGVKIAGQESDEDHPYGHERFEPVAAIILAGVLLITGLFMGHGAIEKLSMGTDELQMPGLISLVAAILSIGCKEAMYWYTRHYAREIRSSALMADAWHHRSDALSSVGALIGIAGARMGYLWFDQAAVLIICIFIAKASFDIFRDAVGKMVDKSAGKELDESIKKCAEGCCNVQAIKSVQTREFGNRVYAEIEVYASPDLTLFEADILSNVVHDAVESEFPEVKHIIVQVRPLGPE